MKSAPFSRTRWFHTDCEGSDMRVRSVASSVADAEWLLFDVGAQLYFDDSRELLT